MFYPVFALLCFILPKQEREDILYFKEIPPPYLCVLGVVLHCAASGVLFDDCFARAGGTGGIRTHDQRLKRPLLLPD